MTADEYGVVDRHLMSKIARLVFNDRRGQKFRHIIFQRFLNLSHLIWIMFHLDSSIRLLRESQRVIKFK